MRFHVFLCLWSVTSCLCIDYICKVAKIKVSKPKKYSLSKLRLIHAFLKQLIQTHPHVYVTMWGDLHNTTQMYSNERRRNYYSRCSNVAAAAVMSWRRCVFRCERETTFFGLPNEYTTRNQWLSYIYNTVPEQYNANIRVCAVHFTEDCFLNLAGE